MGSNSSAVRFVLFSKLFREVLSSVKYSISLSSLTDSPRDSLYVEGEMVSSHWFLKFRIRIRDYYGTVVVGQERDGPSLWRSITCWPVADNISDGPNYRHAKNRASSF